MRRMLPAAVALALGLSGLAGGPANAQVLRGLAEFDRHEPFQAGQDLRQARAMVLRSAALVKHAFYAHQAQQLDNAQLSQPAPPDGPLDMPTTAGELLAALGMGLPAAMALELEEPEPGVLRACLTVAEPNAHEVAGIVQAHRKLDRQLDFRATGLVGADIGCESATPEDEVNLSGTRLGVFLEFNAMSLPEPRATLRPDTQQLPIMSAIGTPHSQMVRLTNHGTSARWLKSASSDVPGIFIGEGCDEPVRPGASCDLLVSTDGTSGSVEGTLTFTFSDEREAALALVEGSTP